MLFVFILCKGNVSHFKIFRWTFSIEINTADRKAHYYLQWWFFIPGVLHLKQWKTKIHFSVFQKLASCPSLHSTFTKSNRDRMFAINLSLSQDNILSDFHPVLFSISLHCPTKLIKKKKEKKESPCFMKCHLWCYQSLYCVKQVDFMSWRKPMAHKLSRGEWVMTVFQTH